MGIGEHDPDDIEQWSNEDRAKYDNRKAQEADGSGDWSRAVTHLGRMMTVLGKHVFEGENPKYDGKKRMKGVEWL